MTDMYNEFRLGSDAVEYIKSRLANGKTLARCLLKQHDLGNGEVVTLLPPNADPERMKNFSGGGVLPTPPPETHQHYTTSDGIKTVLVPVPNTATRMVEMIREFLKEGEGRICIFESAVASPTDGFLSSPNAPDLRVLTFEDDVYYFVTEEDLSREKIKKTIGYATSYLVIGALVHLPMNDYSLLIGRKTTRGKITRQDLCVLADRAEKVIVGAYDGEGYLIWGKNHLTNVRKPV